MTNTGIISEVREWLDAHCSDWVDDWDVAAIVCALRDVDARHIADVTPATWAHILQDQNIFLDN